MPLSPRTTRLCASREGLQFASANCRRALQGALACLALGAAADIQNVEPLVLAQEAAAIELADDIFDYAELGYLESRSSARLAAHLEEAGFTVQRGVADIPTAFVAESGSGAPVLGVLAEYDALPGLSQAPVPTRQPVKTGAAGHACGHNLFGAASVTAGIALARWLEQSGMQGTVRVYGTPAEEGGSGKVYMVRAGLFDDVDTVLHWHPGDRNNASPESSNGNKSGRFEFHGVSAHAASSPERGRSALDGVEAMNHMVNMMREHVPSTARLHYVITEGGDAPNIVPAFAEVYYYVRHPRPDMVAELFERVVNAAEGAALGTGTEMRYEVMHGNYPLLPSETLAAVVHEAMVSVGGFEYDEAERRFALAMRATLLGTLRDIGASAVIAPSQFRQKMGSTDVGDVSWMVPTAGFTTATWVPGTPAHSWQATAAGGMSIGHKGMVMAARVLALTGARLYAEPSLIASAKAEFNRRRGPDFDYRPLLGDRSPPLDYRK